MAVQKVKLNNEYIYIDDEVDEKETGIAIYPKDKLDDTILIEPISENDALEDTLTDIFGGQDEQ